MRLIDADKLRFRHKIKCNSNTTRPYTLNCISFDEVQNAPTIKAVPIDVLDKIRAEFINRYPKNYAGELEFGGNVCYFSLNDVIQIINYVLRIDDNCRKGEYK